MVGSVSPSGSGGGKAVVRVSETKGGATTYYLNDAGNPTGYARAVEEKATPNGAATRSYVLGLRVEGQGSIADGLRDRKEI